MRTSTLRKVFVIVISVIVISITKTTIKATAVDTKVSTESKTEVEQLIEYLYGRTDTISKEFDMNSDKKINAVDLTLLKKKILAERNGLTTTSTTITTTTTTSTTVNERKLLEEYFNEYSSTKRDDSFEMLKDLDGLYEYPAVYKLRADDGLSYEYRIIADVPEGEVFILTNIDHIKGLHVKRIFDEDVPYYKDELPKVIDKIMVNGKLQNYYLIQYKYVSISQMEVTLAHASELKYRWTDVPGGDYNLNGNLDYDDLRIQMDYYMSYPGILDGMAVSSADTFWTAFDYVGLDDFVLYFDGRMEDYCYKLSKNDEFFYEDMLFQIIPIANATEIIENKTPIGEEFDSANPQYVIYSRFMDTIEWESWAYYNPDTDELYKLSKNYTVVWIKDGSPVKRANLDPYAIDLS